MLSNVLLTLGSLVVGLVAATGIVVALAVLTMYHFKTRPQLAVPETKLEVVTHTPKPRGKRASN